MIAEVKVPEVGESITEGTIVAWLKEDGDSVQVEDPLFDLETDKVTMTVPSEFAGRLSVNVPVGETVAIGQVVATIDTDAVAPAEDASPAPRAVAQTAAPAPPAPAEAVSAPSVDAAPVPVPQTGGPAIASPAGMPQAREKLTGVPDSLSLSPAVRRMVEEHKLDPATIAGTGRGGRITKEDVLQHLQAAEAAKPAAGDAADSAASPAAAEPAGAAPPRKETRQTRTVMSPLRQRIAERLVEAQQTAAILTTFNEADMSQVLAWRARHRDAFKEKYGISLGFMSFFVKAVVDALKTVPQLNAQIQGDEVVQNHFYDIGVAISSDKGLVVPVIRDADQMSFARIEETIADLAARVRSKRITLTELSGGVFSITNGGIFGSLMSTPILNPPQCGILGMHAIKKRAMVKDDQIVILPMMYLALSYDHRIVDGREAVTFLKRIVQCIEDPERMMLEV